MTGTAPGLQFRFELLPVAAIAPFGRPGSHSLHWFGLTDGFYSLDTPAGRLLEYASPPGRAVEYYVVRLFEDLLEIWPFVAEPVPADIAGRTFTVADPDGWTDWWHARRLDFSYLQNGPSLHFWRVGDVLNVLWGAKGTVWAVPHARFSVPFAAAHDAVAGFCRALLDAMGQRVLAIERDGWTREDCTLDVAGLVAEQPQREAWAASALSRVMRTDWEEVRRLAGDQGAVGESV